MKKIFISSFLALAFVLSGGASAQAAGYTFSKYLKVGSTGADVSALQQFLIDNNFSIPAITTNVASKGYFGQQTKTAVIAYQTSLGLPNTGFVGPLTVDRLNRSEMAMSGGTPAVTGCPTGFTCTANNAPVVKCPIGYTCTANPGTVVDPLVVNPGPATEGSFTVSQAANPANNTNVTTSTNVPVYGVKIKAMNSAMVIDRADLQFAVTVGGTTVNPAGFITSISAWDGTTLLKTMPLTSSDFTKDNSARYYVRLTGIGFKVPKDVTKDLVFSVNVASVNSADTARVLTVVGYADSTQNIRGTDGLGLQSYGNNNWTSTFTFQASNNSTLTGSSDSNTVKARNIAVNTSTGIKGVEMMTFNAKSTIGSSVLTNLRVYVKTNSVSTAAPTALYLYDGSTLLSSASVTVTSGSGTVNFTNLLLSIAQDATKKLTVKADFPSTAVGVASTTILTAAAEIDTTLFETGDSTTKEVTIASAIVGNNVNLYATAAPQWTLVSASATGAAGVVSVASSSVTAIIKMKVSADGGTLTKPVAGDFAIWFASTTQTNTNGTGSGYTAATGISVTPTITVDPNTSTVGDGNDYTVTLTATIYSSNSLLGSSQPLFMAVQSIDSVTGSNTITDQTWGIDNFYTNPVQLTRGTL